MHDYKGSLQHVELVTNQTNTTIKIIVNIINNNTIQYYTVKKGHLFYYKGHCNNTVEVVMKTNKDNNYNYNYYITLLPCCKK